MFLKFKITKKAPLLSELFRRNQTFVFCKIIKKNYDSVSIERMC